MSVWENIEPALLPCQGVIKEHNGATRGFEKKNKGKEHRILSLDTTTITFLQ